MIKKKQTAATKRTLAFSISGKSSSQSKKFQCRNIIQKSPAKWTTTLIISGCKWCNNNLNYSDLVAFDSVNLWDIPVLSAVNPIERNLKLDWRPKQQDWRVSVFPPHPAPLPLSQLFCWTCCWSDWWKAWWNVAGRPRTARTCSPPSSWSATPSLRATPRGPPCAPASSWLSWWTQTPRGCWWWPGPLWSACRGCSWPGTMWRMCVSDWPWATASTAWWSGCGWPGTVCTTCSWDIWERDCAGFTLDCGWPTGNTELNGRCGEKCVCVREV